MPTLKSKLILSIVLLGFVLSFNARAQYRLTAKGELAPYAGVLIDLSTYRTETAKMRTDAALIKGLQAERGSLRQELELCRVGSATDSLRLAEAAARLREVEALNAKAGESVMLLQSGNEALAGEAAELTRRLNVAQEERQRAARRGRVLGGVGLALGVVVGLALGR